MSGRYPFFVILGGTMFKAIVTAAFVLFSTHAMSEEAVETNGKVFYKMPNGELVKREVTLILPSKGEGDVILRSGDHEVVAHHYFSKEKNGRIVFTICFPSHHGEANEMKVFRGTYVRGTNKAIYYGDIFKMKHEGHDFQNIQSRLESMDEHGDHEITYTGGFGFKKDIESDLK
jgi:hypothetical protein